MWPSREWKEKIFMADDESAGKAFIGSDRERREGTLLYKVSGG